MRASATSNAAEQNVCQEKFVADEEGANSHESEIHRFILLVAWFYRVKQTALYKPVADLFTRSNRLVLIVACCTVSS